MKRFHPQMKKERKVEERSPQIHLVPVIIITSSPQRLNVAHYTGSGWTLDSAQSDCAAQPDHIFTEGACDESQSLGTCSISSNEDLGYDLVLAGEAPSGCQSAAQGCVVFARGDFSPPLFVRASMSPLSRFSLTRLVMFLFL